MEKLIEVLFELVKITLTGVFNVLQVIFGADPEFRKGKYNSKFMSTWDRLKLVSSWNKGVTLGTKRLRISKVKEHTLIIGGSGSGKTSSVIIPSILNSANSFICTDVDGSIYEKTSGYLSKLGYSIQVLNLADISRSEFYNPMAYCQNDSDLKQLAEQLIQTAYKDSNSESTYWSYGAQNIIYIILRLLKNRPPMFQNLSNLRFLLQRYSQLEDFVVDNASQSVYNDWVGFISSEEKIQSGMVSSALVALDKLSDAGIGFLTSKTTLDFAKLTQGKKSAIFIQVPESKLDFYSFILSILYNSFFQFVQLNKPKHLVYAYLDEFAQLNFGKNFPVYATTMRRYNLALVALIQAESQLLKYGSDGFQTLFNGSFSNKLVFGGMSLSLAQQLSQSFGRKGVAIQPQSKPYLSDRELMTVQELIQLSNKKAVFVYRGKAPLIMKIKPYFKQYKLKKRSKIAPVELLQNPITTPPLISLNPPSNEEE